MEVRFRKLSEDAVIPSYAHIGDAGMDLVASSMEIDDDVNIVYHTGIAIEIPEGYVGLVFPRSSNCKKKLWLTNSVGVIDSGYRGEITFKYRPSITVRPRWWNFCAIKNFIRSGFKSLGIEYKCQSYYKKGDRVGQLIIMPYPKVELVEADFLFPSERGCNGYGSTGK